MSHDSHGNAAHMSAGHSHDAGHSADHGHGHGGAKKYLYVFLALCVLSTASFITTSETLWPFSRHVAWAFMMAVSCGKAMLVVLFFMHVKYEANWKYVLTIPCSIMAIFLALALVPDVGMRQDSYSETRKSFAAEPEKSTTESHGETPAHRGER